VCTPWAAHTFWFLFLTQGRLRILGSYHSLFRLGHGFYFLKYRRLMGRGKKVTFMEEELCACNCVICIPKWSFSFLYNS
jgi:hypothetical protein